MNGWLNECKFIYKHILIKLILDKYNENQDKSGTLVFGNHYSKIKNLKLIFYSKKGKEKIKTVIKNYKFKKNLFIRLRFYSCIMHDTFSKNWNYFYYRKIELFDLYYYRQD